MRWFKFYGQDWLTDLKVRRLSLEDKMCFITLLCLASTADEGGIVRNCDEATLIELSNLRDNPYDDDNEYRRALGCLSRYAALQIVTLHDNGDVTVNNFERRQGENLSNAERQKAYRERLKSKPKERNSSNVTRYNDSNARREEKRIEKNRIEEKTEPSLSFLEKLPEEVATSLSDKYHISPKGIQSKATDLLLYCKQKGKVYKDYQAFLENALRKDKAKLQLEYPLAVVKEEQEEIELTSEQIQKNKDIRANITNMLKNKSVLN